MSQQLIEAITDMREAEALQIATELLDGGTDPVQILDDCRQAMEVIGQRFGQGQAFVPELVMGGEIMKSISGLVKPRIPKDVQAKRVGKVVVGTVEGDIHDIGKDIVAFLLDIHGFEVIDLGVDASPQVFVDKIREFKPQVVALSGFLTLSYASMKRTVDTIREAGLRDEVKIMVGGGVVDDHVRAFSGADAFGADAMAAVALTKSWIGG